ncbi:MAG: phosphoribosylanthranilate isomerase [Cyanobium sp. MAG_216]|jgi:phosphoribosylanthranilate isomerase|uniref:phosphoribosylanthranilate isomerase n=1 Tax=Cyanobium sp. TaxID=2164130 RepID=UPI00071510E2|nr:MAG: phosphoribosylanthranilate isomerase [cyanobacterium BACL30 MAG-120619-bin27]MDP4737589.1 phosphoribosylanthranilate isomerase [Cyanobium sp. MAG_216]MDP4807896.1 phosphoribosylanthranilate isomerase [Cyanobium sp. MAG_160]
MAPPLLKICGLRDPAQAAAVAQLGVDAIGVIGVPGSPRFLEAEQRPALFAAMRAAAPGCRGVLVVADPLEQQWPQLELGQGHAVVQLHGSETPQLCGQVRSRLGCEIWKALRIRRPEDLQRAVDYAPVVDALLLDAWVPDQLGGTGHPIPIEWLQGFTPVLPWWLAGGIRAERVPGLLSQLGPTGLDASSGVERSPGDKDLDQVAALVAAVRVAGLAGPSQSRSVGLALS